MSLPPDSAYSRSLMGEGAPWTLEAVLLAGVLNVESHRMWMEADPKTRGPRPRPVRPPFGDPSDQPDLVDRLLDQRRRLQPKEV